MTSQDNKFLMSLLKFAMEAYSTVILSEEELEGISAGSWFSNFLRGRPLWRGGPTFTIGYGPTQKYDSRGMPIDPAGTHRGR
jgi:hypothetical protein